MRRRRFDASGSHAEAEGFGQNQWVRKTRVVDSSLRAQSFPQRRMVRDPLKNVHPWMLECMAMIVEVLI